MQYVLYCPQCGKSMRVARDHIRVTIVCPHCSYTYRPAATTRLENSHLVSVTPAGLPEPRVAQPSIWQTESRSRVAAGLLGIFLGSLGLHRFYLGYNGIGLLQLAITVAAILIPGPSLCCAPLVAVWGFTEGIFCLMGWMADADGRPLGP